MGKNGMVPAEVSQDEIKIPEAQKDLKLIEDQEIIQILVETAKKVKGMIFQEHTSRHWTTRKKNGIVN
jgi:hypothetical protein